MNREEYEQLVAEFLYGEISDADRLRLDEWLKAHPEDRKDVDELRRTMHRLTSLPEVHASLQPLEVTALAHGRIPTRSAWRKWTVAAAAVVLVVFCVSRGLAIQVGTVRVAVGPAAGSEAVRHEIRQELEGEYLPVIRTLSEQLQSFTTDRETLLSRQEMLEKTLALLSAIQSNTEQYNRQQLKRFANEFINEFDRKMVRYLPANYVTYTAQEGDKGLPWSNQ